MFKICSDLSKKSLKIYYFCQHSKKAKRWPNSQTISFLANSLKKGQIATLQSTHSFVTERFGVSYKVAFYTHFTRTRTDTYALLHKNTLRPCKSNMVLFFP